MYFFFSSSGCRRGDAGGKRLEAKGSQIDPWGSFIASLFPLRVSGKRRMIPGSAVNAFVVSDVVRRCLLFAQADLGPWLRVISLIKLFPCRDQLPEHHLPDSGV